jgi:hypothetical protein
MERGVAGARAAKGVTREGARDSGRGVACGGGAAQAEARRGQWNISHGEGRGMEDEQSGFFERDGSRSYAGQAASGRPWRIIIVVRYIEKIIAS